MPRIRAEDKEEEEKQVVIKDRKTIEVQAESGMEYMCRGRVKQFKKRRAPKRKPGGEQTESRKKKKEIKIRGRAVRVQKEAIVKGELADSTP